MGNSNIKQHIETASKTGACQLTLRKLRELPPELMQLSKTLRTLDVSNNNLQRLCPPDLGQFTMLKQLTASHNSLCQLPDAELKHLKKLECLSVDNNYLTRLPASLGSLTALRTINLSNNKIDVFPEQLCQLLNLDSVNLSCNHITRLPSSINSLQAIELNLNQNQLSTLPEDIADCPRLKVLRLLENCLDISAFTPKIMKNSKISLLSVDGNVFDMKDFYNIPGYENYMERFTATKMKFN
ncbi:leucine-rich repeat-containing protein 57 [Octopus vulgaris]|uniref:Leucine-rich repeat-containing protein 57 n=2 Tax=Octopus TaxID=6643 RepID=A0A9Y1D1H5_OCTVU|nr:leucine-rich repeat-containing protein 57 [Octopus sinensis]UUA79821.1 leucine-rich repeat-containing protein 57 [Octopus vulgaris]CAI9740070.1 leucine-rich repeat-containing protein 57 [Octopus vulgaris]